MLLSRLYRPFTSVLLVLPFGCAVETGTNNLGSVEQALEAGAACETAQYEAEEMFHSTGGETQDGWNIWSNGYISANHIFEGGTTTISIVARGQSAAGAAPNMRVTVNGNDVYNSTVGSSHWTQYNLTFEAAAGEQEIRVYFTNDYYQNGQDRNLYVDSVAVGCGTGQCGNGTVNVGEECDDGSQTSGDSCKLDCTWNVCGDGVLYHLVTEPVGPNTQEQCDDGNDIDDDECTNSCTLPACGDGVLHEGEVCDDGNNENGDGCADDCSSESTCGDGTLDDGEECDDGNDVNDDACSDACVSAACGDGLVQENEACDDGNNANGDGCSAYCTAEPYCGDGVVDAGEECDDGNDVNDDACGNQCVFAACGDGVVQENEACDDGNSEDGDGCSSACTSEASASGVLNVFNQWETGYCAVVEITNEATEATSSWSAVIALGAGTTYTAWGGDFSATTGASTITPSSWNSVIAPGARNATVGFCVNHVAGTLPATDVSVAASY